MAIRKKNFIQRLWLNIAKNIFVKQGGSVKALRRITGLDSFITFFKFLRKLGILKDLLRIIGKGILSAYVPNAIITGVEIALDADDLIHTFNNLKTITEKMEFIREATMKYGQDALPDAMQEILTIMTEMAKFKDDLETMSPRERETRFMDIMKKIGLRSIPPWVVDLYKLAIREYENEMAKKVRSRPPGGLSGMLHNEKKIDAGNYARERVDYSRRSPNYS